MWYQYCPHFLLTAAFVNSVVTVMPPFFTDGDISKVIVERTCIKLVHKRVSCQRRRKFSTCRQLTKVMQTSMQGHSILYLLWCMWIVALPALLIRITSYDRGSKTMPFPNLNNLLTLTGAMLLQSWIVPRMLWRWLPLFFAVQKAIVSSWRNAGNIDWRSEYSSRKELYNECTRWPTSNNASAWRKWTRT